MRMINSFRDLIVWQKATDLSVEIYKVTEKFPREDIYGITSQMRRAAISIPSNIAEGRHRGTRKDFHQFLRIAYGSGAELETQIEIAFRLKRMQKDDYDRLSVLLNEIMRMLNVMIKKISNEKL
jgi:four helix bundle protein